MSSSLVVGGSPLAISAKKLSVLSQLCDFIVAVDKGMDICIEAGIIPDLYCGDGDSISRQSLQYLESNHSIEKAVYDPHKDDTDLSLAIREVVDRGYDRIVVASLLGGRLDHQLAVLGVLKTADTDDIWWVEDDVICRILSEDGCCEIQLNEECVDKTISCISLSDDTLVTEQGTLWEADHLTLGLLSDRGVSNVVTASGATIKIHRGSAIICINEGPLSLINE